MAKNIAVLFDGTWNVPGAAKADRSEAVSNVYRIWKALGGKDLPAYQPALESDDQSEWGSIFYIRGVGSSGSALMERVTGATGIGVIERIAIAYHWFCSHFEEGDTVAVFGFSRGAFSARSFCGLLAAAGIKKTMSAAEAKLLVYDHLDGKLVGKSVEVQYLGIFDTVGTTIERENAHRISPSNVRFARHALALDEIRSSFRPHFWDAEQKETNVKETWFVGVHSNVGGSYPDKNLSNIALFWILKGAAEAGIEYPLRKAAGWDDEKVGVGIRDSWEDWFRTPLGLLLLVAECLRLHQSNRNVAAHHTFHESVAELLERRRVYVPAATAGSARITAALVRSRLEHWNFR